MKRINSVRHSLAAALLSLALGAGAAQANIIDMGFEDLSSPWDFSKNASGTVVAGETINLTGFGAAAPLTGGLFAYMGTGAFDIFPKPAMVSSIRQDFAAQAAPVAMAFRFINGGNVQASAPGSAYDDLLSVIYFDTTGQHDLISYGVADLGTKRDSGWINFAIPAGATRVVFTLSDFGTDGGYFDGQPSYVLLDQAVPDTTAPLLAINPLTAPAKTNRKNLVIGGTAEAGSTVVVSMGTTTWPATLDGANWSCQVSGLASGANSITVTATDAAGNATTQTATITFAAPDGMVAGGSDVSINDALKALRIAIGILPQSADDLLHGDVAPPGAPDDKIDVSDVLLILRKAVGLVSF